MTATTAPNGAAVYPFVVNVPYHPYRVALICDCGKPAAGFAGAITCSGCSKVFSVSVLPLSHEPPRTEPFAPPPVEPGCSARMIP